MVWLAVRVSKCLARMSKSKGEACATNALKTTAIHGRDEIPMSFSFGSPLPTSMKSQRLLNPRANSSKAERPYILASSLKSAYTLTMILYSLGGLMMLFGIHLETSSLTTSAA